jgi:thiol:disulfide interchange protein
MKLLALAKAGHNAKAGRRESLFYGLGVLITFLGLGLILGLLGSSLGWGFQLQSPWVTASLALLMLGVGLNMSGLFHLGSGLQRLGSGALSRHPDLSALMTGILAVIVAAPCTAPFMATAIGVALAQGGLISLGVFLALGLGFAIPVIALTFAISYSPKLANALPKPGKWMDRLRQILAVPMYGAALWMAWVFSQQVNQTGLLALIMAMVILGLALWWPFKALPKLARMGAFGLVIALSVLATIQKPEIDSKEVKTDYETFSTDRIAQLQSENKPVLVNLTAAWCVTCKVNEGLVFNTKAFKSALSETNTVYMVGDWTNQDADITQYLSQKGRSGVPLYVYYGSKGSEPVVLEQMIDKRALISRLRQTQ